MATLNQRGVLYVRNSEDSAKLSQLVGPSLGRLPVTFVGDANGRKKIPHLMATQAGTRTPHHLTVELTFAVIPLTASRYFRAPAAPTPLMEAPWAANLVLAATGHYILAHAQRTAEIFWKAALNA